MTTFEKYVCDFANNHTIEDTIFMLRCHADYIQFTKYSHTVSRIKQDDDKIQHIAAMVSYLRKRSQVTDRIKDFKTEYFGG